MMDEFATDGYRAINKARQIHLGGLGLELEDRRVLELGAGVGDHTLFWVRRGCIVTSVDGRQENLDKIRQRYPTVTCVQYDLDHSDWPFSCYDIIYAYGILYHLQDPIAALERWARDSNTLLILETVVSRDDNPYIKVENSESSTACLHGECVWPSIKDIVDTLQACGRYVYRPVNVPNHEEFPSDWSDLPPTGSIRAVFIASRKELSLPTLRKVY